MGRRDRLHSNKQSRRLGHEIVEPNGAPVRPRDAATLIIWRKASGGPEVLLGRRSHSASFVPGFFVFPGGCLDPADYAVRAATPLNPMFVENMGVYGNARKAEALAIAAVRETFEETGLLVAESGNIGTPTHSGWNDWRALGLAPGLAHLGYFGRAITSTTSTIRFNARFFIAQADLLRGRIKGSGELSDLGFYPVNRVVEHMPIVDVTEFMLKQLVRFVNDPSAMNLEPPIFSYRHNVSYIRYRPSHKAVPQPAKEFARALPG